MQKEICFHCKNYIADLTCEAFFPERIPDEILTGFNNHKKPLRGQKNKIVFEANFQKCYITEVNKVI